MASTHPTITDEMLRDALSTVIDPEIRKPITELGMVETAAVDADGLATATILLTVSGCPMKDTLTTDTTKALAAIDEAAARLERGDGGDERRSRPLASSSSQYPPMWPPMSWLHQP